MRKIHLKQKLGSGKHLEALLDNRQFAKFLGFGIVGMTIDNTSLVLLNRFTEINILMLKAFSAELSITTMFMLNNRYTFRSAQKVTVKFIKSNLVRSGGVIIAMITLYFLYNIFNMPLLLANTAGIGAGFAFNYAFETLFTWKQHEE